jgi:hypothetical protein
MGFLWESSFSAIRRKYSLKPLALTFELSVESPSTFISCILILLLILLTVLPYYTFTISQVVFFNFIIGSWDLVVIIISFSFQNDI